MWKNFRSERNDTYWDKRWSAIEADADSFENMNIYPIKYAEMVVSKGDKIAELGCGMGRVLKHYHYKGYDITGVENSMPAVRKLSEKKELKVVAADARHLPFKNESFDTVLAFGLYHNIEDREEMEDAIAEASRCLKNGGKFCISMQPDNAASMLRNLCFLIKTRHRGKYFHKWLVGRDEFALILNECGFKTENIFYARNVSFLWQIPFFRLKKMEETFRSLGYKLNRFGEYIDNLLRKCYPKSFCEVFVYKGRKA